jgi:ribosomal protein L18E
MPHPTGPTDPNTKKLVAELRKVKEYKALAKALGASRRKKAELSLGDLGKVKEDKIATAGKILAGGELAKAKTVYAWRFSEAAAAKIKAAGGKSMGLEDLLKSKEKVKII